MRHLGQMQACTSVKKTTTGLYSGKEIPGKQEHEEKLQTRSYKPFGHHTLVKAKGSPVQGDFGGSGP